MRFGLFGKGGPDKSEAAAQANRVKELLREIAGSRRRLRLRSTRSSAPTPHAPAPRR